MNDSIIEKLGSLGFKLNDNGQFINNNIVIYYREKFKEWRLKELFSHMDYIEINFPLNEEEIQKIKVACSQLYKTKEV